MNADRMNFLIASSHTEHFPFSGKVQRLVATSKINPVLQNCKNDSPLAQIKKNEQLSGCGICVNPGRFFGQSVLICSGILGCSGNELCKNEFLD